MFLSPFPWKKTPKFWSFFVLGSLLFRGGKIPISSHAKPPRPEEVSKATVSSLGPSKWWEHHRSTRGTCWCSGSSSTTDTSWGLCLWPKNSWWEFKSPNWGCFLPNGRTSWLINGGYQLLTNWNDPPDSRWCMGWDMVNVGHSTTTKKICVFFLVISLQLVEFGEGRFERKAEQF